MKEEGSRRIYRKWTDGWMDFIIQWRAVMQGLIIL